MVTLVILDGFGLSKKKFGNAIKSAGTPHLDKLLKIYPHTELLASGEAVGLPFGQMGNSEVGHLTIGAGRTIPQDLLKINRAIEDKSFFENKGLQKAISHAEMYKSNLHIMGLLSNGGVHSHINHLFAILTACEKRNIEKIYIHAVTDGRDTGVKEGLDFIKQTESFIKQNNMNNVQFASICGRIYAMDREKRYSRLEKAYKTYVFGENFVNLSAKEALENSYESGVYDEFVEPKLLIKDATFAENDSVIFFNYRSDRAREITDAITNKNFKEFKTKNIKNLLFSPMQEYSSSFKDLNTLFPPIEVKNNLSAIISEKGLSQFHIAETTKYAHVTFFFNGGIEKAYQGETRKLIESVDTQDFSYYPKMRAIEITEQSLDAIASAKYDFILVNYSNPDMVGHTGNFEATKEAITCVEKQAYALALATLMADGECIITADHGNAEEMIDNKGNKITSHTTNKVPFILVSEKNKKAKLKKHGSLANIAPTVLKLMNLDIPKDMENPLF